MDKILETRSNERLQVAAAIQSIADSAAENGLSDTDRKALEELSTRLDAIDADIKTFTDLALRNAAAAETLAKVENAKPLETRNANVRVISEEMTYRNDASHSFFRDVANAQDGDYSAMDRLQRHGLETRATTTSTMGSGFVLPDYLTNDKVDVRKYGRPVANAIGSRPVSNASAIWPKVSTGLTVAAQATQNTDLGSSDVTTTTVQADYETIGGYTDVALQVLRFSSGFSDADIYAELVKDYNAKVENFVLNNNASNKYGILRTSGVNSISYTSAASYANFHAKVAEAKKAIYVNYKGNATHMIVSPTVFAWLEAQVDTTNRPIFSPVGSMNNPGVLDFNNAQGVVGNVCGLNILVSHAVPADHIPSATPNDSPVIVADLSQMRLNEDTAQTARFDDVGSATGTVRFRLVGGVQFTAARLPEAISIISGAGLAGL